jgi:hypothetical protein
MLLTRFLEMSEFFKLDLDRECFNLLPTQDFLATTLKVKRCKMKLEWKLLGNIRLHRFFIELITPLKT